MKITKIILSIITMLFAVLGLVKILPFDIANPIMLVSLATLLLLRSVEYKNNRDKGGFIMTCLNRSICLCCSNLQCFYRIGKS